MDQHKARRIISVIMIIAMITVLFSCGNSSGTVSDISEYTEYSAESISSESSEESSLPTEDAHWITIEGIEYGIPEENVNAAEIRTDGIYITNDTDLTVSPRASVDRVDVVLIDGMAAYVSPKNIPAVIPNCGGAVITFAGSFADKASAISIGDSIKTRKIVTDSCSGYHVTIDGVIYPVDIVNGIRTPEGVTALYTPEYGKSTGTNQYGIEIAVSGGKVIGIETGKGDMAIPEDGFVLSIHKDAGMYSKSRRIKKGVPANAFLGRSNYCISLLTVSGTNTVRSQDSLIMYKNVSSTGTNPYGFEIAVDENGVMVDSGHSGNIKIPKNGFVLSGHGINEDILVNCWLEGGKAVEKGSGKVLVYYSPDTLIVNELKRFDDLEKEYQEKRASFACDASSEYEKAKEAINKTKELWETGEIGKAGERFENDFELLSELEISLIDFPVIENRATWYRSSEKSEAEVRETVSSMAAMGINTLYLETWYNGSFAGFSDNDLIIHTKANGDFDALEAFTRVCHEYCISIHAWVENFFIGTVESQEQANMKLADHFDGRWLKDKTGKNTFYYSVSNTNFIFMNPYDSEVRSFLVEFYDEILTKYDVDGIHLDYIRFPELNYGTNDFGYNDDIVSAWQESKETKADPRSLVSGDLYASWVSFRKEIITSFVGEIDAMMNEKHPNAWLSAAVYPEPSTTSWQLFQDPYEWVKRGYVDELVSMTYSGDNSYIKSNASSFVRNIASRCFYSTGISAFSGTPWETLVYQPGEARTAGANGFSVFSFSYFDLPSNLLAKTLSKTRSARVDDIDGMIEAVYGYYTDRISLFVSENALSDENAANLKNILTEWKKDCTSLERNRKKTYLSLLSETTEKLKENVSALFTDKADAENAVKQIEIMLRCLDILETRESD